jgi:glycerol-3-phosphate acyltransferase PlsY
MSELSMQSILSVLIGYLLGCMSPAAFLGRKHNKDLRKEGTGNLGATNTLIVLGAKSGILVMVFDIAKAFIASRIAKYLFPRQYYAGLLAGTGAVFGHCFPCHMKFKGGKGVASFAGMMLAHDPLIFLILLAICIVAALIVNYGVAMPLTAAILYPVLSLAFSGDFWIFGITAAASILLIVKHWSNIGKAMRHEHDSVRGFFKARLSSHKG